MTCAFRIKIYKSQVLPETVKLYFLLFILHVNYAIVRHFCQYVI